MKQRKNIIVNCVPYLPWFLALTLTLTAPILNTRIVPFKSVDINPNDKLCIRWPFNVGSDFSHDLMNNSQITSEKLNVDVQWNFSLWNNVRNATHVSTEYNKLNSVSIAMSNYGHISSSTRPTLQITNENKSCLT